MNDAEAAPTAPTNVHDLPPELIGRAATYLDIRGGDFWKLFTFVAGRRDNIEKRIIKRVYLERNVQLILYVSDVYSVFPLEKARMIRLGEACRQWMEFNDDWRNSIKPYPGIDMPGLFADVEPRVLLGTRAEATIHFSGDNAPFRGGIAVVGVDGRDVSGLASVNVGRLLDEGLSTQAKIRIMKGGVAHVFLNPVVAIDLGLTEVLRYLIEDVGIDVNTQHYSSGVFNGYNMPLVAHALVHPDPSSFQYLMSVSGLNANPIPLGIIPYDRSATTLLHLLNDGSIEDALDGSFLDISRIETLLNRDEIDVDILDDDDLTPLDYLVDWDNPWGVSFDRNYLLLIKAFLDAGASTSDVDLSILVIRDREGHNGEVVAALLEANDHRERDEIIASLDRP
mmetsp:Transcript_970/g.2098  ORF Transcript_970/g.2098 Transcript_970/m.2098 type:complete len:395 (+) Transcript_970:210-1394(+)|eukprot:CAMPEP_0178496240 /NCGR_PEP_ID=MMETSP0696-20121128/14005_1 /TAXON_ID=265572 /ORGANISM="Extubocellulus spinifer, Strain CCMP396" /LENGTH=394 /DNA_ID=CAMNT_0020124497 /DNA_START=213 /DNA_END=1397 /DNA_ORIENTATION=+